MGRPLLDWQLESLRAGGAARIGMVVGYHRDLIDRPEIEFIENPRWPETNMVYSLCCAEAAFGESPFLVSYSDILYPPETAANLIACDADIAITYDRQWESLWRTRMEDPLADAETFRCDENNIVTEIGGQPETIAEIQGQFMGLLRFTGAGWKRVRKVIEGLPPEEVDTLQMTTLLAKLITAGHEVTGVPVDGRWVEVDSEQDIACYEAALTGQNVGAWHHDWRS